MPRKLSARTTLQRLLRDLQRESGHPATTPERRAAIGREIRAAARDLSRIEREERAVATKSVARGDEHARADRRTPEEAPVPAPAPTPHLSKRGGNQHDEILKAFVDARADENYSMRDVFYLGDKYGLERAEAIRFHELAAEFAYDPNEALISSRDAEVLGLEPPSAEWPAEFLRLKLVALNKYVHTGTAYEREQARTILQKLTVCASVLPEIRERAAQLISEAT